MPIKSLELGSELIPLTMEGTTPYRRLLARTYVRTWRAHPTAWEMHVRNKQFQVIDGVHGIPATLHCVAQALRAEVLAWLLGLRLALTHELVTGVLLTDASKADERRYMLRVGPSWESYAHAQVRGKNALVASDMFSPRVIVLAMSVAHESLLKMLLLCAKPAPELTAFEVAQLIAHYVDDISRNHDWVVPATADAGNMLDIRMRHNANNATYAHLNEEGRSRLPEEAAQAGFPQFFPGGETTYEAQARVGHDVESVLARLIMRRIGRTFKPLDLPVIIDNVIRSRMNDELHTAYIG